MLTMQKWTAAIVLLAMASCAAPEPEPEVERTVEEYIERVEKDYARFREKAERSSGEEVVSEGPLEPALRPDDLERELEHIMARIRHLEAVELNIEKDSAGVEGKMREYEKRHRALMAEYESLTRDLMRLEMEREARKE
jgi:chromosome segregation ATPase